MNENELGVLCSPVSMVTRSNGLPPPDVKTPSLVTFSRIGPRTLQGPHQLIDRYGQCIMRVFLKKDNVLGVEVSYDDLVLDLKRAFEPLTTISHQSLQISSPTRTFWSTFGKWPSLLAEHENIRTNRMGSIIQLSVP